MPDINVDFLGKNGGSGEMAAAFAANGGLNLASMRPWVSEKTGGTYMTTCTKGSSKDKKNWKNVPMNVNGTLRRDEWKQLDEALLELSRYRLGGVDDLITKGLTFNLGNAMGTTVLEYHTVGDAFAAELTMDGITKAKGDRPIYETHYLPIPIIHVDYEINARVLEASRKLGNPLDVTSAGIAGRKVKEYLENMLFTDIDYAFGGGTIYSYVNHPDINTVSLGTNWDASAKTAAGILEDIKNVKAASIAAYHYGPWMLYIPTAYETVLDDDYDATTPGTTIRERILKVAGIEGIKVVDTLAANNVLLVQMTPDVVRLVQGMGIQNIQEKAQFGFVNKFKVLTIQVPQIRSDQDGNSGITLLA